MTTHYNSASRGPVEIGTMRYEHLLNAHDKLKRDEPHRAAEIAAMRSRLDALEAEFAEADKAATQ